MNKFTYIKLNKDAFIKSPFYKGDAGYDISSIEEKWVLPFLPRVIKTGIILQCPKTLYAELRTRSGHGIKRNLRIHPGIIDSAFRGEITIKVFNLGLIPYKIKKGEKIAQVILHKLETPIIKETTKVDNTRRGSKGFGSSGR